MLETMEERSVLLVELKDERVDWRWGRAGGEAVEGEGAASWLCIWMILWLRKD